MQEHGAEGAEKSKLKAPSFTIINGISIRIIASHVLGEEQQLYLQDTVW